MSISVRGDDKVLNRSVQVSARGVSTRHQPLFGTEQVDKLPTYRQISVELYRTHQRKLNFGGLEWGLTTEINGLIL